jgi:type III secretory pathway component EscV
MTLRDQHSSSEAVRITTAAPSKAEEIAARQRRYLFSMAIRTACFIAAVAVGPGWPRWVLIVLAIILPYVAVVMANVSTSRSDSFEVRAGGPAGRELGP